MNEVSGEAAAVDPVEPDKVCWTAKQIGADLKLVLTTHHHWLVQIPSPLILFASSDKFLTQDSPNCSSTLRILSSAVLEVVGLGW